MCSSRMIKMSVSKNNIKRLVRCISQLRAGQISWKVKNTYSSIHQKISKKSQKKTWKNETPLNLIWTLKIKLTTMFAHFVKKNLITFKLSELFKTLLLHINLPPTFIQRNVVFPTLPLVSEKSKTRDYIPEFTSVSDKGKTLNSETFLLVNI